MTVLREDAMSGKVVLISGGTQGIGAAAARTAAGCGAEAVIVTGRRPEVADPLIDELDALGTEPLFVRADVGVVEQAAASVATVIDTFGRVDCVVNAAALTDRGSLLDTTPEMFDAHVAINLRGPFFIMQAAIRDMLARESAGTIVNVISISSHTGSRVLAPYVASKGGLAALTRNVAHAHRYDRIRVNGLNIGWTATEGEDAIQRRFHDATDGWRDEAGRDLPAGRLGDPSEIADMIVYLLSDGSGIVTGSVIDWDQNVMGGESEN
jgi:NAD(P)-dependent dehydrogenase (short-subunit alcohol dehydrogenase family)